MSDLSNKRFLLVTGKGGVGKTTVCAALALSLAKEGKRVLVALCNTKDRLSTMLGVPPIGNEITSVRPNVWAVNMEPDKALEEYGSLALRSKLLFKLLFDNKYVRTFFRAVPGMQEWTLLGKAWWHTTEQQEDGTSRFDVVILDAPATGHGLDMLRVPKIILEIVPPGPLRRDAELAWKLFQDPKNAGVVLVTLPEDMPTTETIELATALTGELGLPLSRLVVNSVLPVLFSDKERARIEALAPPESEGARSALDSARSRGQREALQSESLTRLAASIQVTTKTLPQIFGDASSPKSIEFLAGLL